MRRGGATLGAWLAAGFATARARACRGRGTARKRGEGWRRGSVRALLAQRADPNDADADGTTALHWAVHARRRRARRARCSTRARAPTAREPLRRDAAASSPPKTATRRSIDAAAGAGADANRRLPEGETALMTAARTGDVADVEALLAHGADVNAREELEGPDRADVGGAREQRRRDRRACSRPAPSATRARRAATSARCCSRCAPARSRRRARCSTPAPTRINTLADGTSALVLAATNAHYELAADAARARRRSERRGAGLDGAAPDRVVAAAERRLQPAGPRADRRPRQPRAGAQAGRARRQRQRAPEEGAARRQPQHAEPDRRDAVPAGGKIRPTCR